MAVTFVRTDQADMAEMIPGATRQDDRTVAYRGDEMSTVFRVWRAMLALASYVD
jgi:D-aminopeptidase